MNDEMNDRMKSVRDRWALDQMSLKCAACSVIVVSSRDGWFSRAPSNTRLGG
jgi:hypothetical protein